MHVFVRFLPFVVTAWSLGMFRRVRLDHVAALKGRALRAEAEREERARRAVADERTRIARDVHDVVAHALSVITSQANGGRYAARGDPERGIEALNTIAGTGRQALADGRGTLTVLRDDADVERELFPRPLLKDLPALFDRVREAGVAVEHSERGSEHALSPVTELAVFRLVQEALTNTLKHVGPGARAEVDLSWCRDELVIAVRDDGPGPTSAEGGQGLVRAGFVMVVESQEDMRVVGEAGDGHDALHQLTAADVVLMDVRMPRMDGVEATRRVLTGHRAPKVVMLTTYDLDEYAFAALRAGAGGFLVKDSDPDIAAARSATMRGGGRVTGGPARRDPHRSPR